MGARSIAGGRGASLARTRDTTGKFWKWKFLEKFHWEILEELEKFGI
jgi:hypothetical protein